ncbi:uncharacterized protein EKO05_0003627 [Ascochyta rabiei]|uniref:uncharacterized protein n=1 Tax=Didymella rabiei TaxID=5454 RepID=UPI0021FD5E82|nr:uncharacterized protein EKO05_0003627 [Ascochyta rabiei]UPX13100.1 hypothetical protein EKO05_0003627 [Ascochyta rabiei]
MTGLKHFELKKISDDTTQDNGPAAGLLAAHRYDPNANWMVVACNFPVPVPCFVNTAGFSEPILAIWSSEALQKLRENVEGGRSGPNYAIKQLKGKLITPAEDDWILNTDTREE